MWVERNNDERRTEGMLGTCNSNLQELFSWEMQLRRHLAKY
jgi:hypothetical protein